jgi:hypothetical protein
MITPKEFLETQLRKLANKFTQVQCSYEFHNLSDAHYVEINPFKEFDKIQLQEHMIAMLTEFYQIFPGESLVFLNEGDGVKINPEFTIRGVNYMKDWSTILLKNLQSYIPEPISADDVYSDNSYALAA